ncbi:MAG: CCA tRNA nucleotidyltransferase [Candidatus Omnitrophica bacterium]|nr:CCA tRNA nucleotidyltransferase [Candidatus Omnitrophota bacterium]
MSKKCQHIRLGPAAGGWASLSVDPFDMTMREVLRQLNEAAQPLYLVGGWVRDELLRLAPPRNADLAMPQGAVAFAQRMAQRLGGHCAPLDAAHGSARLVVQGPNGPHEIDCTDFRAPTLEQDLRLRDFTVNAMAYALPAWLAGRAELIDPLRGYHDLQAKRLRAVYPQAFHDDAVRILRGAVFAARFGLAIEPSTQAWMREAAPRLATVAAERSREELFKLFSVACAAPHLRTLDELGALEVLLPEIHACRGVEQGGYHHLDVWQHSLETLHQLEEILAHPERFPSELRRPLDDYLHQPVSSGHPRSALLKFAALLHDLGKPAKRCTDEAGQLHFNGHEHLGANLAAVIAERLRCSTDERQSLERIILWHLRPGYLIKLAERTRRALYRYFRDTGTDGPAVLLHWLADRAASQGPATHPDDMPGQRAVAHELLTHYFLRPEEVVRLPKLIRGDELMAELHLAAGPVIGELLRQIEEAQAERRVTTKEEALALAKQVVAQRR